MTISRRQFLKRGALVAAGAAIGPHMRWVPGTNVSYAAGPTDAIVVVVQLNGGNDGCNTVYPLSGQQRTTYEEFRPTLGLPGVGGNLTPWANAGFDVSEGILNVDGANSNPDGESYALNPTMKEWKAIYDEGDLAIINGVHYPFADYSHFRSEKIYYSGDPLGTGGNGWLGHYLNQAGFTPQDVPGVNLGSEYNPIFTPTGTSLLAFTSLSSLDFPASGLTTEKKAAFEAMYAAAAAAGPNVPELVSIGNSGVATINTIEDYYLPGTGNSGKVEALLVDEDERYSSRNPLRYTSPLNEDQNPQLEGSRLARDLRHVAATIRADVGARFFHVRTGGFDTHSSQENGLYHSGLLHNVSEAVGQFYREIQQSSITLPPGYSGYLTGDLSPKVLIVTLSEFGRTAKQNAQGASSAGTDHATSAPQFVIGSAVQGGHYGAYPALGGGGVVDDNDLEMRFDFRDLYGTMLERWLGVDASEIDPATGTYFPATPADEYGYEWPTYTPIPYLLP